MKKNVFVLALFCFVSMMANAEVAKYCMSYEDFVADNWKSLDELTAGRTKQVCQIKSGDHGVFYDIGPRRVMATYHPSALLRDVSKRPEAFMDLRRLRTEIRSVCERVYSDIE